MCLYDGLFRYSNYTAFVILSMCIIVCFPTTVMLTIVCSLSVSWSVSLQQQYCLWQSLYVYNGLFSYNTNTVFVSLSVFYNDLFPCNNNATNGMVCVCIMVCFPTTTIVFSIVTVCINGLNPYNNNANY